MISWHCLYRNKRNSASVVRNVQDKKQLEQGRRYIRRLAEKLGKSDLLKVAKAIALTHHEHWDGSGYPAGQRQGEIPLAGRIAAVCDVFDALTSERPYKKAWEFEEAVAEIARLRGINFDPEIVDVFMKSLSDLKRVYQEYAGNGEDVKSAV